MLRLLADENLNGDILRGLFLRRSTLDLVRVQDTPLVGAPDPAVLAWSAENNRVILTHDRATMPAYALERMSHAESMPGLLVINDRYPVGEAIQEILLLDECTDHKDWLNLVVYLPV